MAELTIGGSEAAAAIGLDPYRSRIELWAEKTGKLDPRPAGESALWGTLLEPIVREQAAARESVLITSRGDELRDGYMIGHPDGRIGGGGLYEGKTCSAYVKGWNDDGIPIPYIIQTHHYMHLTGDTRTLLACLVGGQRLETRWLDRDDALLAMILEAEHEFIDYCQRDTPPPPDGSPASSEVLKRLYPAGDGGTVTLTAEHMQTVGMLRAVKEARKATEAQEAELENTLKLVLGDAWYGLYEGERVVSWPEIVQQRKAQEAREVRYRRFTC